MIVTKRAATTPCLPLTKRRAPDASLQVLASDRLLLRYIEGWAEADAVKIAGAVTADYRFIDPLVGRFDRDTLHQYFAILRRRVGFGSVATEESKVCLDAFPTPQLPARTLQFWRSIPECGLAGISDIEICHARVHKEVVCYELNIATEYLRRVPYASHGGYRP
ncbi:MAG TPA: hypothetical protein VE914_16670 [Candidatus Angelobacter sp.]|nr:hypothetical protein [Candidatus Angelobacter sp.]